MITYIGIDPGLNGAIAINCDGTIEIYPMPTFIISKSGKKDYDITRIGRIIEWTLPPDVFDKGYKNTFMVFEILVVVEERRVMPTTDRGLGIIEGIVCALKIPFIKVKPSTWKREMLKNCPGDDPKEKAILQVERLFPEVNLYRMDRYKKPDHNYADALLLMEYGRRIYCEKS